MAVVRARTSPPYGLIAAVTFALLATGAAVVLYVVWAKASDDLTKANAKLARLSNDSDTKTLNTLAPGYEDSSKPTAVATLANLYTTANTDLGKANDKLTGLNKQLSDLRGQVDTLTSQLSSANASATLAEKKRGTAQTDFDKTMADNQATITKLQTDIAALNASRDDLTKTDQATLSDELKKAEDIRRQLVLNLEDATSQIAKANREILELRMRIRNQGGKTDVAVGEPDGKVLSVNNASGEVYINLGAKDRMKPGMPFTAYDPRTGVRFATDAEALGNGSLEVIEVGPDTSICRITRTSSNRAIQANDLISNLVYHNDKTRQFRFTVFGDFDLDGDGVATAGERDRLITLIKAWGGQVDDDVTAQTDFLVLGTPPKGAMTSTDDTAAPASAPATDPAASAPASGSVSGSVGEARNKDQQRYEDLEIAAKTLAIPVLNQNRFLAMVGYYNTTVVRY